MRILHIVSDMNPANGGIYRAVMSISNGLSLLGVENEILSTDSPTDEYLKLSPFKIFPMGPGVSSWNYSRSLYTWLGQNIQTYDAIVIHGLWQYHTFALSKLVKHRRLSNYPTMLVMPHGMLDPWFQRAEGRRFKAVRNWIFWKLTERKIISLADGILFTCETEKNLARLTFTPYNPLREIVVGLGIERAPKNTEALSLEFFRRVPELLNKPFILFLGRIDVKKGVDLLVRAYNIISKENTDVPKLVIAGPGLESSYGLMVRDLAGNNSDVIFPGILFNEAKWGAFYNCEAFILPSHQENFGIAVAEALSCGKPVLISDQVNIWREIEESGSGLVDTDTLEGTTNLLRNFLILNHEQKENMQKNALTSFEAHFTISSTAHRIKQLIDQLEE
jgi:glycosyltransferase involved in cell wall biosynthesis